MGPKKKVESSNEEFVIADINYTGHSQLGQKYQNLWRGS